MLEVTIRVAIPPRARSAAQRWGTSLRAGAAHSRAVASQLYWLWLILVAAAAAGILKGLITESVERGFVGAATIFVLSCLVYAALALKRRHSPLVRD